MGLSGANNSTQKQQNNTETICTDQNETYQTTKAVIQILHTI